MQDTLNLPTRCLAARPRAAGDTCPAAIDSQGLQQVRLITHDTAAGPSLDMLLATLCSTPQPTEDSL